jgi:hypothetical protein
VTSAEPRFLTNAEAWQITLHEAGHAVAAVRLDFNVEFVERGDGEHGETRAIGCPLDHPDRQGPLEAIRQWQQFYAAGAASELLIIGSYREYASARHMFLHGKLENRRTHVRANGGWSEDIEAVIKILDRESILKVARKLHPKGWLDDEQLYGLFQLVPPWDRR